MNRASEFSSDPERLSKALSRVFLDGVKYGASISKKRYEEIIKTNVESATEREVLRKLLEEMEE